MGARGSRAAVAALVVAAPGLGACGALHCGAAAAAKLRTPPALVSQAPFRTATPTPTATPSAAPAATAAAPPAGTALTFSGAITGTMVRPLVVCEQRIPVDGQGAMAVSGDVGGVPRIVTVWSASQHLPQEVYVGPDIGVLDYLVYRAGGVTGVAHFDWARGATLDIELPAFAPNTGPPIHVSGTIACP